MPITNQAIRSKNIVELFEIKDRINEGLHIHLNENVRIESIEPVGDSRVWNTFRIKFNGYLDHWVLGALEGIGYEIADISYHQSGLIERWFEVVIFKIKAQKEVRFG